MTPYVIYSRKSQEDEDSQVQSIPDQERVMKEIAERIDWPVKASLSESKSAKAPGRPVFDAMMKRVEKGEIRGILCWKLDRLARNPVDGGRIIWAIKQQGLVIRTPHQTFSQQEDNLILMYIEFGMAQKYVDDLSRNTLRGLKSKAEKGWFPGLAPLGYLNSKVEENGQRTIFRDPERFDPVRRMWDLMLTGKVNPGKIQQIATDEWGFRTRQTKKTGGKPLARSTLYNIFSDPFYYGKYEYPKGSGVWYQGQHEPMVTQGEFEKVQQTLHQDRNPRPQIEFAIQFAGLINCGECGSRITAHFKEQVRCTGCRYKFSLRTKQTCVKCRLSLNDMKAPKIRRYAYYHCTKSKNPKCRERAVPAIDLERQLTAQLNEIAIQPESKAWGMEFIGKLREDDLAREKQILVERKKAYDQCVNRLENLLNLKTSPDNARGDLLSDEEYQKRRGELLKEKSKLASDASTFQIELERKTAASHEALNLAANIGESPLKDDTERKKEILSAIGSNHELKGKKLVIKPVFPFSELPRGKNEGCDFLSPIEPDNTDILSGQNDWFGPIRPSAVPKLDEVRTRRRLKKALKAIWKKVDLNSPELNRWPFIDGPKVPPRRRHKGRFV